MNNSIGQDFFTSKKKKVLYITYLLHLQNKTSPPVARKTPDHARRPKPAVNFGRFDAAAKFKNKKKTVSIIQKRVWSKSFAKKLRADTHDYRMHIGDKHQQNHTPKCGCKPQFRNFSNGTIPITSFVKQPSSISLQIKFTRRYTLTYIQQLRKKKNQKYCLNQALIGVMEYANIKSYFQVTSS